MSGAQRCSSARKEVASSSKRVCGSRWRTIYRTTPPALSQELAALIPGAKLHIIEGASHIANLDKPAEFNAAIDDLLSEADRQA